MFERFIYREEICLKVLLFPCMLGMFEGPGQNVPEYSWWDYINTNTGAVGCVVLLVAKISVSSLEDRINFDTMVLGRRFRILETSCLISLITCIANGILFFPLHNMMYFLKLSHINDARV